MYDSKEVKVGSGLVGVTVGVFNGVPKAADALKSAGAKLLQDAAKVDDADVAAVADEDGYTVTLLDLEQFNTLLV